MSYPIILPDFTASRWPWMGGRMRDVGCVRGRLVDLAAHFHVPLTGGDRTLSVVLVVPDAGLLEVANQNIDNENLFGPNPPLTPQEVERMTLTEQDMALYVGIGADAEVVRRWVASTFPPSIVVGFDRAFV